MPSSVAACLATTLSPIIRICSADGPMKTRPCSATICANPAFSERNPSPGWMASAPVMAAAERIAAGLRYLSRAGGGPMQTLSSASRTCMALASAVECTATVRMPISRQARWMRRAISPRLAISTFSNMRVSLLQNHQHLAELDRRAVGDQDFGDAARAGRVDLIHYFHGFDHQQRLAFAHAVADLDEMRRARLRREIGGADHR